MTLLKFGIEIYPDIIDEVLERDCEWCSECHTSIEHETYYHGGENSKKRKLCSYCYGIMGLYGE